MLVYPTVIPVEAVSIIIQAALKPNTIDKKRIAAAGYQVLGYVLGQAVGEPDPKIVGSGDPIAEIITALKE